MGAGDVVTVPMPTPSADELDVTPFRLRGVCAQDRLDAVVAADLARRGADLRWSTRLVGIAQDADGVDVELEGPDGRYSLRCAHVVAADGTHSAVRTALGAIRKRSQAGQRISPTARALADVGCAKTAAVRSSESNFRACVPQSRR